MSHPASLFGRKWRDSDASGNAQIDREHRGLLETMAAVEAKIRAGAEPSSVYRLLEGVVEACTEHFANEEAIIGDSRYPEAIHHREEHAALAARMRALMKQHADGDLATMEMLTALFYEPLVLHMVRDDRAFFPYLRVV
ncbi:MAG: hemerythrin domain-containing protein [Burkholderiales bacterium]